MMRKLFRASCLVAGLVACHSSDAPDDGGSSGSGSHVCSGPLDRSVATDFYDAVQCLFSGPDAPQQGVTQPFDRERIAVIHGRVLDDNASPVAGATVAVAGHPEWGSTETVSDGTYDLAVDGGDTLIVQLTSDGHIPSQRHLTPAYRRFAMVGDVTLRAFAAPVAVTLGTGSIVDGATSQDASGARSSAVYFAPGTTATIDAPGGPMTLSSFHLHTTEFTVGDHGPSAMPGDLPPTSAYTYAIDFTVDEAVAAGAKHVTFDPPAVHYVDNFLHFPVGAVVPNGYFDADTDRWIAGANGLVVAVVTVDASGAQLDIDGDGVADPDSALAKLGITPGERATIGQRFTAGKTVWRVPIPHFSTWDHNWPFQPPADALPPLDAAAIDNAPDDCKTTSAGSIIGCDDQSLGEVLPIDGTPYTLHYQSERAAGRTDRNDLVVQLAGATVPASLQRIDASIEVLGNVTQQSFSPGPNATWQFSWDGTDAYGRAWQGRQTAHIKVGYVYAGSYDKTTSFSDPGIGPITGDSTRQEVTLWKDWDEPIGGFDVSGFGGWTIDAVHALDAEGGVLALGDGHTRVAEEIGQTIATVAGNGLGGSTGDGGAATKANIDSPHGVVTLRDGSVIFSEDATCDVRRVAPDGTITTIAGIPGMCGSSGDGGAATAAQLNRPLGLALAPDGTLYIADGNNLRVRAISPAGVISTYAGGGMFGPNGENGDGGAATAAAFGEPHALALGHDGSLYVADDVRGEIRKIAPDGTISTIAGHWGNTDVGAEGAQARSVAIQDPLGLAVGPNNEVYLTEYDGGRVRRVDAAGTITTVIGLGTASSDDGSLARTASVVEPHTVDIGADGTLYVTEEGLSRVREITPDGLVFTIAGGGNIDAGVDNVPPLQARFSTPRVVMVDRDGTLLVADWSGDRVRRIRSALPAHLIGDTVVASQAGDELYAFDGAGRHHQTIDAWTGAPRLTAVYDAANRLVGLTDRDGNTTTIERASDGTASAIVSPYGTRTALGFDAAGNLATVTDANGAVTALGYDAGGLLVSLTEPRGDVHRFGYDAKGRLTSDANPSGLVKKLAVDASGVTLAAAGGATSKIAVSRSTITTRTFTDAAGLVSTFSRSQIGASATTPTASVTATYAGDPRFGMIAPYAATIDLAEGPQLVHITHERTATLGDASNPLSLQTLVDTVTVNNHATVTTYDAATRSRSTVSPMGRTRSITFDAAGRVIASQHGDRAPIDYSYDGNGRLVAMTTAGRTYAMEYDGGWLASIVDPSGNRTVLARDAAGRPIGATLPDGSGQMASFDADGNVVAIAGHARTYGPGNLIATDTANGVAASASYDHDGRAFAQVRADGIASTIGYDAAGRIASIAYGGDVHTLGYDATTGQLATASSNAESLTFDHAGELRTGTFYSGSVSGFVTRTFDNDFVVTQLSVGSSQVSFEHDADALITRAGDLAIGHDGNGAVTSTTLGTATDTWTYDTYGDVASHLATASTGVVDNVAIARDANGRIAQRTETIGGATHTDAFAYDGRGRLISQFRDGAALAAWTWNTAGERTSDNASYDANGRLTALGNEHLDYDTRGALIRRTAGTATTSYAYDATGALASVTTPSAAIAYITDPLGRRIARTRNGTRTAGYLYDEDRLHPVAQVDASGTVVATFVYGSRAEVPDYVIAGGGRFKVVSDERGSVRAVVDVSSGAIVQRIDYDAFGMVTADSNPGFQPFGFAGGLYDPDTGLVHFGARDYDPATGRFLTLDPIGVAGGLNPYLYANGDPINRVDRDGHLAEVVAVVAGEVILHAVVGGGLELIHELASGDCVDWSKVAGATFDGAKQGLVEGLVIGLVPFVPVLLDFALASDIVLPIEVVAVGSAIERSGPLLERGSQIMLGIEAANSLGESFQILAGRVIESIEGRVMNAAASAAAAQTGDQESFDDDPGSVILSPFD